MRSSKRVLGVAVAVLAVAGLVALPGAAQAQSCTPVPVSSTGITIEAAGREVRVPSVTGVAVCADTPGTPGIPWVETEPGGGVSVLLTGSSGGEGSVSLRYSADGVPNEIRVPIPGTDGSSETCLVGVGFPARDDCLFKVSPDNDPIPTLPPVDPSIPPIPTVEPTTLPTVPPVPEDPCVQPRLCVSDVFEIIERHPEIIEKAIELVIQRINDLITINPCLIDPKC